MSLSVAVGAQVEAGGQYVAQPSGTVRRLDFHLVSVSGQWRIDEPPDGVLLSTSEFSVTYGPVSLYFPDLTRTWLVPDIRWYPASSSPTVAINALLTDGPADWLSPAVARPWPSRLGLTSNGVKASEGTVVVDLNHFALDVKPDDRTLLYQQIRETLQDARRRLQLRHGRPAADRGPGPTADPDILGVAAPAARPAGRRPETGGGGHGDQPPGPPAGLHDRVPDQRPAGAGDTGRQPPRCQPGRAHLRRGHRGPDPGLHPGARTTAVHLVTTGTDLTVPSVDRYGWAWTTPAVATGKIVVGRSGRAVTVAAPWLAGARVTGLRISPEGSRAVVLMARGGGAPRVMVCAVVRDDDGLPIAMSPAVVVVADLTSAVDVSWVDALQVAVLGTRPGYQGRSVWLAQVGGTVQLSIPAETAQSLTRGLRTTIRCGCRPRPPCSPGPGPTCCRSPVPAGPASPG